MRLENGIGGDIIVALPNSSKMLGAEFLVEPHRCGETDGGLPIQETLAVGCGKSFVGGSTFRHRGPDLIAVLWRRLDLRGRRRCANHKPPNLCSQTRS